MSDRIDAPVYRVRISHAHTLKDGWRCDSTTVECTFSGADDPTSIMDAIKAHMNEAYLAGSDEAESRNRVDTRVRESA